MGKLWYGIAIGAVVGPDAKDVDTEGMGGAKNVNNDKDSNNGGQGLFSAFGHQVWVYLGGIVGVGNNFGVYGTTGPMIGTDMDWAVGGGIHIARAVGVGVVIPIRAALAAGSQHSDKISHILDKGQYLVAQTTDFLTQSSAGGLEQITQDPLTTSLASAGLIAVALQEKNLVEKTKEGYRSAKNAVINKIYGI